jgi:alanine racemase
MESPLSLVDNQVLSVAVIDLNNLAINYAKVKSEVSETTAVAAVVKANSYGFGAVEVSKKLYNEGCRHFFVATIDEGIEIRNVLKEDAEIYVLSGIFCGCEELVIKNKITPVLNNIYQVNLWIDYSKKINAKLSAVIQVDTGMCRNGLSEKDVEKYCEKIKENLKLSFILSHLACADDVQSEKNVEQLIKFKKMLDIFGSNVKASFSATNGIFLCKDYHFDMVRPGKALYGFSIREDKVGSLSPVMNIYARIVQINELPAGETIGYGATYTAKNNMKTVTIGMGYADGFMRKFSEFGHGFLGGKKIPMVGRISMDYMVLDATGVDESFLNIGDWVALTRNPDYTLEKWALEMDTLPHEVSCRLGKRVKKIYIGNQ